MKNMASEGIWLVEDRGNKSQRIMKLADLKGDMNLFPYAAWAEDIDQFASFLSQYDKKNFYETLKVTKDGIQYMLPPTGDYAKDILKFLSLSKESKKKFLKELVEKNLKYNPTSGCIVDDYGRMVHPPYSKETVEFRLNAIKIEAKRLRKRLKDLM